MWRNHTDFCLIEVLFAPFYSNTIGRGEIEIDLWNSLAGTLVDGGIYQMNDATSHPADPYENHPPTNYIGVYFNDSTFMNIWHTASDGLVYVFNGTWDGTFSELTGFPNDTSWDYLNGVWLEEGGFLVSAMNDYYSAITTHVPYPDT
jgi:hypothetical protein